MRRLNFNERKYIEEMIKSSGGGRPLVARLDDVMVESIQDGGMGSLLFLSARPGRILGKEIARGEFKDEDGVWVMAVLSLDNFGDLYELDVWKTDFSKLKSFP